MKNTSSLFHTVCDKTYICTELYKIFLLLMHLKLELTYTKYIIYHTYFISFKTDMYAQFVFQNMANYVQASESDVIIWKLFKAITLNLDGNYVLYISCQKMFRLSLQ